MIYLIFEVVHADGSAATGKIFASCWINKNDEGVARRQAVRLIEENDYKEVNCLESYAICREDYVESKEGLEYFEQALIDEEVLVLFVSEV